jgi:hypothetical protein
MPAGSLVAANDSAAMENCPSQSRVDDFDMDRLDLRLDVRARRFVAPVAESRPP